MIDRHKLEFGSLSEKLDAIYKVTCEDIKRDPSIVDVLRDNIDSSDEDLVEISIMRLGVRAKDLASIEAILSKVRHSDEPLVRAAAIAALSSLYGELLRTGDPKAIELKQATLCACREEAERAQVEDNFNRHTRSGL